MSNFESMLFSHSLKLKLINLAMAKTFNKFDAEDLVQQTYLRALERQDQFRGDRLDPWVITILKNLYTDSTRKGTFVHERITRDFDNNKIIEKKRLKRVFSYGDDVPEATVIDESDDYLLQRDKDKCLERLSDKERELIALKQNNSYKEICEDLNIKEGTLRQAFSRAKEKFMECMGFIYD